MAFNPNQPRDPDGQWSDGVFDLPGDLAKLVESVNPFHIMPLNETGSHEAPDPDDVAELAESMTENGWQGAPILAYAGSALTGTHRIAAAREAGVNVNVLDLNDILDDAGSVIQTVQSDNEWAEWSQVAAAVMTEVLGQNLAEALGMDLDFSGVYVDPDLLINEHLVA